MMNKIMMILLGDEIDYHLYGKHHGDFVEDYAATLFDPYMCNLTLI